jgi:uncharacterized membrane protein YfbV (UPF0208 family)
MVNEFFNSQLYDEGIRFGCWGLALYAFSCAMYSMVIEKLIKKFTAKRVFVCSMLTFSLGMAILGKEAPTPSELLAHIVWFMELKKRIQRN